MAIRFENLPDRFSIVGPWTVKGFAERAWWSMELTNEKLCTSPEFKSGPCKHVKVRRSIEIINFRGLLSKKG